MFPKRIDDLTDLSVQGISEAHLNGELAEAEVIDQVAVRAAGGVGRERLLDVDVPGGYRGSHLMAGSTLELLDSRS